MRNDPTIRHVVRLVRQRMAGGRAGGALVGLAILIRALLTASGAQQPAAPGTKLELFTQTLPKSVVRLRMIPIPGGTVKIGTQTVTVKPFWMAQTETPW